MSMQESMEEAAAQWGRPRKTWSDDGVSFACYHDVCGQGLTVEELKSRFVQLTDNVWAGSSYGCNGFLALGIIEGEGKGFQDIGFFSPDYKNWGSTDFDAWKKELIGSQRCMDVANAIETCLPVYSLTNSLSEMDKFMAVGLESVR